MSVVLLTFAIPYDQENFRSRAGQGRGFPVRKNSAFGSGAQEYRGVITEAQLAWLCGKPHSHSSYLVDSGTFLPDVSSAFGIL